MSEMSENTLPRTEYGVRFFEGQESQWERIWSCEDEVDQEAFFRHIQQRREEIMAESGWCPREPQKVYRVIPDWTFGTPPTPLLLTEDR